MEHQAVHDLPDHLGRALQFCRQMVKPVFDQVQFPP
jgi:hypothetical protein